MSSRLQRFPHISVRKHAKASRITRSLIKAITYRTLIVGLDFLVIYLLTHELKVASGFVIASTLCTTIAYFFHERLWNHVTWGAPREAARKA
jgi:uncharacterized membrane protein